MIFQPKPVLKKHSLAEAYQKLKKYHLSDSLYLAGQVGAVFRLGMQPNYDGVPRYIVAWVQRFENDTRMKLQVAAGSARLARFLLLSGANDDRDIALRLEDNSYSKALDIVGSIYDDGLEEQLKAGAGNLAAGILGRMSWQFQLQENSWNTIARGYLLFVELAREVPVGYDIEAKMLEYFGLGAHSYLATGFALWLKCDGAMNYELSIDVPHLEGLVDKRSQSLFMELSSGSPEDYRRAIRGSDWKTVNKLMDVYFLDAFSRYPAISVKKTLGAVPDRFVVPQPKFLIDRAATGIFHLLSESEQLLGRSLGNARQNPFRVCFGELYRSYVGRQLRLGEHLGLIDLDNDFVQPEGLKKPDFAVVDANVCVLFEIKTSLLTLSARTFFEEEQIKAELKKGSFQKAVDQLDSFRNRILSGKIDDPRFAGIEKVVCILVGYEDIYVLNAYLLPMLEEYYGKKAQGFQLCSVSDVEMLGCLLAEGQRIGEILVYKLADDIAKSYPLMQFAHDRVGNRNPLLERAGNDFFDQLIGC